MTIAIGSNYADGHGHNDKTFYEGDKGDYNAVAAHFIVGDSEY